MIIRLAVKDLVHDWLLSTCLILAIASIIAPLLILFGLKAGTIQTMRGRLVEDPKNREIRPVTAHSFSRSWFDEVRKNHPEVGFVIPMTRQISTTVIGVGPKGRKTQLTLLATGDGDPLLLDNGTVVPGEGECVLTSSAAESLGAGTGDSLSLTATRIVHGRRDRGTLTVRIRGILDPRASGLKAVFVRLDVLEAVEDFKDGRAVPAYGWKGELPEAYPVFDGALVILPNPLSRLDQIMLVNNTGFSAIREVKAEETADLVGLPLEQQGRTIYLVTVKKRPVGEESIRAVERKLRGKGAVVLPWMKPLPISLQSGEGEAAVKVRLMALAASGGKPGELPLPDAAVGEEVLLFPGSSGKEGTVPMTLEAAWDSRVLRMPVRVAGQPEPGGTVLADVALAGRLNLIRQRNLVWDPKSERLLLSRRGYAGFRMYAATIDQVAEVRKFIEEQGITVRTREERIAEVKRLDRYLSLIFWLIATVGVVGGISALTASLYASVERKRKELNILRLLGFLKRQIVLFPVCQGLLLSGTGLVLAGGVFWLVARLINHLFSSHLQARESLCTLSMTHVLVLIAGLCCCSVLSATLAALQAVRLDPAEALRDE